MVPMFLELLDADRPYGFAGVFLRDSRQDDDEEDDEEPDDKEDDEEDDDSGNDDGYSE